MIGIQGYYMHYRHRPILIDMMITDLSLKTNSLTHEHPLVHIPKCGPDSTSAVVSFCAYVIFKRLATKSSTSQCF